MSGLLSDPAATIARAQPTDRPDGLGALLAAASGLSTFVPWRALATFMGGALDYGDDGRLTFLLLGNDARGAGVGRTDTIMIASLQNDVINVASIPRDTTRILNPYTANPTDTYRARVNALARYFYRSTGKLGPALEKFKYVIEQELGIEIDYYTMLNFRAFEMLVDEVDPIYIDNPTTLRDGKFQDDPDPPYGIYFPVDSSYPLYGWPNGPLCNGAFKAYTTPPPSTWCHHALPYVRSRKGPGNNDFLRARRQQRFVEFALERVINNYGGNLTGLIDEANSQRTDKHLVTNLPVTMTSAFELYDALDNAQVGEHVVFAPTEWATSIPGTTAYQLKLNKVRLWMQTYMGGQP